MARARTGMDTTSVRELLRVAGRALRRVAARITPESMKPLVKIVEQSPHAARALLHSRLSSTFPELPWTSDDALYQSSELERFFNGRSDGRGINKWLHYLPIYERHLAAFKGSALNMLEIGVQSGGSLDMWRHYFGNACNVFGVDIDIRCRALGRDGIHILIGDQADRGFWRQIKKEIPLLDVVVDDGGHTPEQQIVSLEELLPHMVPGGVYICEDIYGTPNGFASYIGGFAFGLHEANWTMRAARTEVSDVTTPNAIQQFIRSIHAYPYITVLELNACRVERFVSMRKGSEWL